jgi:CTP synthase (UTP-ammonia lyase)
MNQALRIGIIGDFDPERLSHTATNDALTHAANVLSVTLELAWLPTQELEDDLNEMRLKSFDASWCAPGSPYNSMNGALKAIRFARQQGWPFLGT